MRALRPLSPVPTITGVVVVGLGLLLIAVAWSQVAGEANVARQVPYLVSGGIFGLALVLIGLTVINVASKRRETALREQQTRLLADAVDQLGDTLRDDPYQS
jgi:xanthine/uracil permease